MDDAGHWPAFPSPPRERRIHRHLQRRCATRARRVPGVPQQRHRAATRLAGCSGGHVRYAPGGRPGGCATALPRWPPAGSRWRGVCRWQRVELRAFRITGRSALCQPARSRLLLGRGAGDPARIVPDSRWFRYALRTRLLRRHRPGIRGTCGRQARALPAGIAGAAPGRHHLGHRPEYRAEGLPGAQPQRVRAEVAVDTGQAPKAGRRPFASPASRTPAPDPGGG